MFYIQSSDLIRLGLPWWLNGKELACKCRTCRFDPWVGKIPWGREWQPTLVFLPGKSHRQRSLMGWRLWGLTELDLAGKKPACNAGDLGLIPWLGRSPGEGIGYPLQYFGLSWWLNRSRIRLQVWKTWVWSLGWEGPLEKGTHSSILAWRIPWIL